MKKIILLAALVTLLAGCTTTSYHPDQASPGPATAKDYPIPVYTEDENVPRPCKVIGTMDIGHTMFTMFGGSIDKEMEQVMHAAHEKGADVVKVISIQKPGFDTANFGIKANLLRYADDWETIHQTEQDFSAYLRQHQTMLDPIEGIWSCGWPNRIGIIRDASKPGRDFIAFTLGSDSPAWRLGYRRMDIARAAAPDTYNLRYYHNDFAFSDTAVKLSHERRFQFLVTDGDKTYAVICKKTGQLQPAP